MRASYKLALLVCFAGFLVSCKQFSLYSMFQPLTTAGAKQAGAPSALTISPTVSGSFVGGTLYFTASGGVSPYSFSVLSGGAGGTINSSTGVYTAPSGVGSTTVDTVQVTDSAGKIADAKATVIAAPLLKIAPSSLTAVPNTNYTFIASGGVPPYAFAASAGTISSSGAKGDFGVPSTTGTDTVTVTDSLGSTASATIDVVSSSTTGGTLVLSPHSAAMNPGDSYAFCATGGSGSYTVSMAKTSGSGTVSVNGNTVSYTAPVSAGSYTIDLSDGAKTTTASVTVLPLAPSNLTATAVGGTTVDLSWTNNAAGRNTSGTTIYRATGNASFAPIATGLTSASYSDSGLSPNSVYVYRVAAVDNGAKLTSYYSNEVIVTTGK